MILGVHQYVDTQEEYSRVSCLNYFKGENKGCGQDLILFVI